MDQLFESTLRTVREWARRIPLAPEVLRDDPGGLRIIWETKTHLAELIVCRDEYAPYRFVSFQILDLRREPDQASVYSYFDREDSTTDEILTALDRGMELIKERREQDV